MSKPLVSIIMPVYNAQKVVGRAVESVLNQTLKDFELIIVNDGSSDSSGEILREYAKKDSRINYIDKANEGVAITRNSALDAVKGEMIAFVDADDYVRKDFLERMVSIKKDNNAQMAVCGFERFATDTPDLKTTYTPEIKVWDHGEAMKNCYGVYGLRMSGILWNKIYDANLFEGIRFPENLKNEDEFVLPKLVDKCSKVAFTNEVFYYYFENSNSITTNNKYMSSTDIYKVFDNRLEYFSAKGSDYSFFVRLTKKEYLDRIIARYKKTGLKDLRQLYKDKYNEFRDDVTGIGYKIFKLSPSFYYFLVKIKER
ncbi:glycosyltransferase family 2 protein [Butyrivibrio sp. XPD2006]|uniref:glycosyltransferase family 2 protein n=1 Tax=Butyrivibrio sp. XPD2006 TaxID=1280668 RepID=UPI0003B314C4|nr:glycosyltransferase [Butyrivibrio sp. XPD2006]